MPQLIYSTERTDKDFNELLRFLEDIEYTQREFLGGKVKRIPATERGKKCDYCDMKVSCLKRLEEELKTSDSGFVDKHGQSYFDFVAPYSMKERKRKSRVDLNTKRFKWKK